jgi:PAS domain S-box-containing protein
MKNKNQTREQLQALISERAQAEQAEREQRVLAEALGEITAMLNSSLDLEEVLDRILTHVGRVVPFDAGTILMIEGDFVEVTHAQGYDQAILGLKLPLKQTPNLLRILETGRPSLIEDTHTSDIWIPGPETSWIRSSLGVAIHAGEQVIGFLSLERDRAYAFTPEHIERLQSFAHQAGVAVRNAQLYASVERARQTTEKLRSAQLALTRSLDLDSIYEELLDYLSQLVPYDSATIFSLESDSRLIARAVRGYERWVDPELARAVAFDLQAGSVMHTLVTTQRSVAIPDTTQHPGWVRVPSAQHIRSWLGVPMVVGGKVIGAYSVDSTQPGAFTQEHVQLAESLAVQAAFAVQNARLFADAQRRAAQLEALRRSSLQLTSLLDLPAVLDSIAESVLSLVDAENCHIYLYDEAKQTIAFSTALWKDGRRETTWDTPRAGGLTATVAREGRPMVINDTLRHPLYATPEARQWGIQAIAGLPIKRAAQVLGVLNIVFYEPHTFSEEELQVLSLLTDQAAIAIENARLFAEVRSQKQYSESLVQNSPVAIVTTDRNGNVLSWNPAAEKLFGYTPAEAIGLNLDVIITTPELQEEAVGFTRQTASGARVHGVTRRRRRDGTLVDVEVLAVPVDADNLDAGLIAIYHDITELQRARQDAEAAAQAKSAFLATMSHEIRTPMNAVIGMTSLLLDTELSAEQREFAETIRISGDALLATINDILDFSKIEAGRIELERQPFDLRECVEGAVGLLASQAAEKGLELACLIDPQVPAAISGDETRLRQILLNLLSNAVKFTEQGEVVLDVKAEGRRQKDEARNFILHPSSLNFRFATPASASRPIG